MKTLRIIWLCNKCGAIIKRDFPATDIKTLKASLKEPTKEWCKCGGNKFTITHIKIVEYICSESE